MAIGTLSSKNQITLPVGMVRALGLKAGDKLAMELINGRLVLLPEPANWAAYFKGSMKGFWGTREEIDRYVAEERRSWDRVDYGALGALLARDPDVRRIIDCLQRQPGYSVSEGNVLTLAGVQGQRATEKLEELERLGAVTKSREGAETVVRLNDALVEHERS